MMDLQTKEEAEVEYRNWCNKAPTCDEYFDSLFKANKEQKYAQKQKENWKSYLLSCTDDEFLKQMQNVFEKNCHLPKRPELSQITKKIVLRLSCLQTQLVYLPENKKLGNETFLNGNADKNMPGKENRVADHLAWFSIIV